MEALRFRVHQALEGGEKWPVDAAKHPIARVLTRKSTWNLHYVEDFDTVDERLDRQDDTFPLADLETDVPLVPPDEPWTEYTPVEFVRLFGFEMEAGEQAFQAGV